MTRADVPALTGATLTGLLLGLTAARWAPALLRLEARPLPTRHRQEDR